LEVPRIPVDALQIGPWHIVAGSGLEFPFRRLHGPPPLVFFSDGKGAHFCPQPWVDVSAIRMLFIIFLLSTIEPRQIIARMTDLLQLSAGKRLSQHPQNLSKLVLLWEDCRQIGRMDHPSSRKT
jgi:hypothetical protein